MLTSWLIFINLFSLAESQYSPQDIIWQELTTCVYYQNASGFLFKVIKLLGVEKGKKNKTNLVFLAGNRVLKSIEQSHNTEKALTSLLK